MARGPDDLVQVNIALLAQVSIDLERVEEDPVFRQYLVMDPNPESPDKTAALRACIEHYIARDRFLRDMPFTNGPGSFVLKGWVEA